MNAISKYAWVVVGIMVSLLAAKLYAQGLSPEELVRAVQGTDQTLRENAVDYVNTRLALGQRTAQLDAALAAELNRLNRLNLDRRAAVRAGRQLKDDFPAEYHAAVIEAVSASSNPIAISSLVGALGTGGMVQRGLTTFGDEAVVPVVAVASAETGPIMGGAPDATPPHVVADALSTLRLLLDQARARLSAQSIAAITTLAGNRLKGQQDPVVLIAACQLAITTGNARLRSRVEQLALDRQELGVMGVSDSRWADRIQLTARQLLGIK